MFLQYILVRNIRRLKLLKNRRRAASFLVISMDDTFPDRLFSLECIRQWCKFCSNKSVAWTLRVRSYLSVTCCRGKSHRAACTLLCIKMKSADLFRSKTVCLRAIFDLIRKKSLLNQQFSQFPALIHKSLFDAHNSLWFLCSRNWVDRVVDSRADGLDSPMALTIEIWSGKQKARYQTQLLDYFSLQPQVSHLWNHINSKKIFVFRIPKKSN